MADHQPTPVPGAFPLRILQQPENAIGRGIQAFDGCPGQTCFLPFAVTLPVAPATFERRRQPGLMVGHVGQRGILADPDAHAPDDLGNRILALDARRHLWKELQRSIHGSADDGSR
ncbi:hypothetical protein D3C78_1638460 [compost metagenome]